MTPNSANTLARLCVEYEATRSLQSKATGDAYVLATAEILRAANRLAQTIYREQIASNGDRFYDSPETGYRYAVDINGDLSRHTLRHRRSGKPVKGTKHKRRQEAA